MQPVVLDREIIGDLFRQIDEVSQHLVEHPKTGMLMVLVPAGKFLTDTGGGTPFEVDLPSYYVAVHPVTNAQYARFVAETGHRKPENSSRPITSSVRTKHTFSPENKNHPVVGVSWDDATAYCRWAGLRLPTELEWEKAARGLDGRTFPWGKYWEPGHCRNSRNKGAETTARGWCYGRGGTPFGALQLSGNVWEWCDEWYDDGAYTRYRQGDLAAPSAGESRVVRGGSWNRGGRRNSRDPLDALLSSIDLGDPWVNRGSYPPVSDYDHGDDFSAGRRGRRRSDARDDSCGFRCVSGLALSP